MTRRFLRPILLTTAAVTFLTVAAHALFTNGGFEAGDFSGGWVKSWFLNPSLAGAQPFSGSSIVRNAGGSDRTAVVGPAATPMTLSDPIVAAVQYPRFGQYAGRVNYWGTASQPNQVANSLLQQSVVAPGDVDPTDGHVHARFVYLPVLEDGGHTPSQQAYFYIAVRNVTKGTVIWERFTFANEAGVPWQSSGAYRYTNWQVVDASGGPGVIDVGDTLQLEVVASSCSLGGHRGHVYVDAFGATIPGGSIVADRALEHGAERRADLQPARRQRRHERARPARWSRSPCRRRPRSRRSRRRPARTPAASSPATSPDLAAGASLDFDLTVTVASGATGTITLGNYSVAGTGYPALLGPARTTVVNAPVAAPTLHDQPGHAARRPARPACWPTTPIRTATR